MEEIQSLVDRLTQAIQAKIEEVKRLETWEKTLKEYDRRVQEERKNLANEAVALDRKKRDFEQEKAYLTIQLEEVKKREITSSILDSKREEVKIAQESLKKQREDIDQKLKQLETLTTRQKELDQQEAEVKNIAAGNLIRQGHLDQKEQAVLAEQKRLQALAESWNIKK